MRRRYCNIICPYCSEKFGRWLKLKKHIETIHIGLEVPEWILKEVNKSQKIRDLGKVKDKSRQKPL